MIVFRWPLISIRYWALMAIIALAGCGARNLSSVPASPASGLAVTRTKALAASHQINASTAYSAAVLADNPLVYYCLDDTTSLLKDSGSHGLEGTYGTSVLHAEPPLTKGSTLAAGFPGGTTYNPEGFAYTTASAVLQPSVLSVEAWIKFDHNIPVNTRVPITVYGNGGTSYGLYLHGAAGNVNTLFYQQTNAGGSRFLFYGLTHLTPGVAYHVVALFDGSNVTTYINGLFDQTLPNPGSISYVASGASGLQIGGELNGGEASFPGTIAQVAIYGSVLSQKSIVGHFLAGQLLPLVTETAAQADKFVDSIGVDTHFDSPSTLYITQLPRVLSLLVASGIRHFRDHIYEGATFVAAVKQLAASNIHGSYITTPTNTMATIHAYPALVYPSLEQFEGENEPDDSATIGPNWETHTIEEQKRLYVWVKSDPATASYPVLGPGLAFSANFRRMGDQRDHMDIGNFHDYMGSYNPGFLGGPFGGMDAMIADARVSSGTEPLMSTECGYSAATVQDPAITAALDYRANLRYMTRLFFEQFRAGISRSYSYEFLDSLVPHYSFSQNGLVTKDLLPKPSYTGIQSLIAAIADPGGSFRPGSLSYSVSGLGNVHRLLLQKRNGTFVLAIWIEAPDWQVEGSGGDIIVPDQSITLTTGTHFSNVSLTTMDENGNVSTAPVSWNNDQATFDVSDKVSLVTLVP